MTIYEDTQDLYNQEEDYGKLMQIWYKPNERSRKWRMASLSLVLCADNFDTAEKLRVHTNWYKVIWWEVGSDPNKVNFKW